jgi:hypothetical protein
MGLCGRRNTIHNPDTNDGNCVKRTLIKQNVVMKETFGVHGAVIGAEPFKACWSRDAPTV